MESSDILGKHRGTLERSRPTLPLLFALLGLSCSTITDGTAAPVATATEEVRAEPTLVVTEKDGEAYRRAVASRQELCPALCRKSEAIGCKAKYDDCLASCNKMEARILCPSENESYVRCMVKQPDPSFECTTYGFAALRPGQCQTEAAAMKDCTRKAMRSARP